ncbi:hypothetical protein PV08_10620 [Exophiala spinifera]|uniref:Enoyl reductase (ER) domain-containing protein n=1 Tax=Exophiala spinifera TaxID=91928 RepID=A0A0D2AY04_9EURO|nr:uncharacterized protein PV08_10620 [Exophiala spinifera]KIW11320.1 hypothetical protein PV08_10620 [Exophiala spinifera]
MKLVNYAAWIPAERASLEVATAPFPDIGAGEVIIRNRAVAVNPVDWKIQTSGGFELRYPYILGDDVAGEVIEVGKDVKHLRKGDRIIAHALGLGNGSAYGGFQLYPRLKTAVVAKIPDSLDFRHAVVLPLSISTAAAGLYLKSGLGLTYPVLKKATATTTTATAGRTKTSSHAAMSVSSLSLDHQSPLPTTEEKGTTPVLLLWGGSSSVGSSVIQLAVASGYSVVATASPANYAYVKALGATLVLDYHNPDIVAILASLLESHSVVGAYDAIGSPTTVGQCATVLGSLRGGRIVSVGAAPDDLPSKVEVSRISSGNITTEEDGLVARKVWQEYVSGALEEGTLKPAPEELVVGNGLYYVQGGLDRQKQGVSARKVVITL